MYRAFCKVLATVAVICCLCMNAGATGPESTSVYYGKKQILFYNDGTKYVEA